MDPDLIARDEEGQTSTVRYEAINAMLLNEFLKEHREVEEQAQAIAEMKRGIDSLRADLGRWPPGWRHRGPLDVSRATSKWRQFCGQWIVRDRLNDGGAVAQHAQLGAGGNEEFV